MTEDFLESMKVREEEYPTALPIEPYAVAIPHTNPECIITPFISCIRMKLPVTWREMAANEVEHMVRFVFMLGFKQEDVGDAHVELLQILVTNCQKAEFMEQLVSLNKDAQIFLFIIERGGSTLGCCPLTGFAGCSTKLESINHFYLIAVIA